MNPHVHHRILPSLQFGIPGSARLAPGGWARLGARTVLFLFEFIVEQTGLLPGGCANRLAKLPPKNSDQPAVRVDPLHEGSPKRDLTQPGSGLPSTPKFDLFEDAHGSYLVQCG